MIKHELIWEMYGVLSPSQSTWTYSSSLAGNESVIKAVEFYVIYSISNGSTPRTKLMYAWIISSSSYRFFPYKLSDSHVRQSESK